MINVKLLQKVDFSEKAARIFLLKSIQAFWKFLQAVKRNQFKFWILLIVAIYARSKFSIYKLHKARRYELNEVVHYIPHGQSRYDGYKHVLLWNPDTKDDDTLKELESMNCNKKNCIFSSNRQLLQSVAYFDAVLFDVGSANGLDELPEVRNKEQVYIMADEQSPASTKHNLNFGENYFNMTYTYRKDSDVQWIHGRFFDTDMNNFVSILRQIKWRKPTAYRDQNFINSIKPSKSQLSAWFVSNCNSTSNRDFLAQKLQTYMNVDIYGECGNFTCTSKDPEKCLDIPSSSSYKFYFAFENSNCVDYITENVFVSMQNNIIPIIFNGVTDMQHFLPPNSYINVNDFNSIKKLVKYLKFLDENPQEFANYFWWRKHYKLVMYSKAQAYCDICVHLNKCEPRMKKQQYLNVENWFNQGSCNGKLDQL